MSNLTQQLEAMRKGANLSQDDLATNAGLSRMTVQRREAGLIDPRVSSVLAIAKTLNVELMLVPAVLKDELESFVRSGGRFLGQPPGAGAPLSIAQTLKR